MALWYLLLSMRPRQWVKNAFVLPALIFSRHLFEFPYLWRSAAAVACFVLLSGVVYLCNDIFDRDQDRLHPEKRHRPLAAGKVSVALAWAVRPPPTISPPSSPSYGTMLFCSVAPMALLRLRSAGSVLFSRVAPS